MINSQNTPSTRNVVFQGGRGYEENLIPVIRNEQNRQPENAEELKTKKNHLTIFLLLL